MKTETKRRIKLALRRFALRWLRKLIDVADDRLHAAEVKLRNELQDSLPGSIPRQGVGSTRPAGHASPLAAGERSTGCENGVSVQDPDRSSPELLPNTYAQWEARRSGIAPIAKKAARQRRQRMTASAFDLKYAR